MPQMTPQTPFTVTLPQMLHVRPNGEVLLYGYVGDACGEGFTITDVIREIDNLGEVPQLVLRINSPGGYVSDGMALFSYLKGHSAHKVVQIDGLAASMASVLAMAGDEIVMAENALMMIHNPWNLTVGEAADMERAASVMRKMESQVAAIYAARTGLDEETVRGLMADETWMTAAEAMDLGFANSVVADASEDDARAVGLKKFDLSPFRHGKAAVARLARAKEAATAAEQPQTGDTDMPTMMTAKPSSAAQPAQAAATQTTTKPEEVPASSVETQTPVAASADLDSVRQEATTAERRRVRDIQQAVAAAGLPAEFAASLVEKGVSVDSARSAVLDQLAERQGDEPRAQVVGGADAVDKFRAGAELALMARSGLGGERNEFTGLSLRELARAALDHRGIRSAGQGVLDMVGTAFMPQLAGAHVTSDFAVILSNVANKSMLKGWDEAQETYTAWTAKGSLTDFKPTLRVDTGLMDNLLPLPEGAEYKHGTFGERGETIQLATYGRMFSITRQAIVNDDIGAFTRIPEKMGRAAKRTIGNLVYAVLTSNPDMSDGKSLFHAQHNNLASPGSAISTPSLDAMRTAMRTQKDPDGKAAGGLNITPAFILVPAALEGRAITVIKGEFDSETGEKRTPNSVRDIAQVISEGRLDGVSTKSWYAAANPGSFDTIEVAYLDGVETPYLENRQGWNVDGVEFKVRIDAGVKALDYRGLYKNAGA